MKEKKQANDKRLPGGRARREVSRICPALKSETLKGRRLHVFHPRPAAAAVGTEEIALGIKRLRSCPRSRRSTTCVIPNHLREEERRFSASPLDKKAADRNCQMRS